MIGQVRMSVHPVWKHLLSHKVHSCFNAGNGFHSHLLCCLLKNCHTPRQTSEKKSLLFFFFFLNSAIKRCHNNTPVKKLAGTQRRQLKPRSPKTERKVLKHPTFNPHGSSVTFTVTLLDREHNQLPAEFPVTTAVKPAAAEVVVGKVQAHLSKMSP